MKPEKKIGMVMIKNINYTYTKVPLCETKIIFCVSKSRICDTILCVGDVVLVVVFLAFMLG